MTDEPATSYDEVPYDGNVCPQVCPDRLAVEATFCGMRPAPSVRCRVLELGCGCGHDLIPLALQAPDSRFLGIDLSRRQIDTGRQTAAALGLANLDLRAMSIEDVGPDLGEFDYVITHGIYSWVPPAVQDKILAVSKERLAPQGVAYVSYNTYPGWHLRGMLRDMMRYHSGRFNDPATRIGQARALVKFLAEATAGDDTAYAVYLQNELRILGWMTDSYLFHEHLEGLNEPLYFHQFMERAAAKGLQYLGESEGEPQPLASFRPEVLQGLVRVARDQVEGEQYIDFLSNRTFRRTLLCHAGVSLKRGAEPADVVGLYIASTVRPTSPQPDLAGPRAAEFRGGGFACSLTEPLQKAALVHLGESWPEAVAFPELAAAARRRLGRPEAGSAMAPEVQGLAATLLSAYARRMVDFYIHPPRLVRTPGARPCASPLARLQARTGAKVTSLRHECVLLNDFDRQVVCNLDGRLDRAGLVNGLVGLAIRGVMQVRQKGQAVADPGTLRAAVEEQLDRTLPDLARRGLLVG